MQKIILLTIISALFLGCSTKIKATKTENRVAPMSHFNYNHKPYLKLKYKRKLKRAYGA